MAAILSFAAEMQLHVFLTTAGLLAVQIPTITSASSTETGQLHHPFTLSEGMICSSFGKRRRKEKEFIIKPIIL